MQPAAMWLVVLLCFFAWPVLAQTSLSSMPENSDTRTGNKQYSQDNYTDAEASYKKALDEKNNMPQAVFNLGDAVYRQKRYDEAIKQFQLAAQTNPDPKVRAQAYHNLGNTYLEQKKWEDAVNAYKEALKLNGNDNDTKYNLAYANAMLQKQKNEDKQKKDNKKNDKDKKDDKKKDDKKDQQNKKPDSKPDQKPGDKDKSQSDKSDQKKGNPDQQPMTKQRAEKMLEALKNEEQKTNQKVQQKQLKPVNVKIQKDW